MRRLPYLAALVIATGCYKINYTTGAPIGEDADETIWHHRFINGMVEIKPVEAPKLCPSGVAKVHTEVSFVNGLANYVSALIGVPGIVYNPATVQLWCKSGSSFNLRFSDDGTSVVATRRE